MFLHNEIKRKMEKFPLYSQEDKKDALVSVKLFDEY
jgi:hypothetical protein